MKEFLSSNVIDLLAIQAQVRLFEFRFKLLYCCINVLCNLQFTNHTFQWYVSQ